MTCILKLSTGKEIELTQEEMEELFSKRGVKYVTVPYCPIPQPYPNTYPYPVITC